jgi:hypothetical protein
MQADHVIWLIVAVMAIPALLFLIRLFRMPQAKPPSRAYHEFDAKPAQIASKVLSLKIIPA